MVGVGCWVNKGNAREFRCCSIAVPLLFHFLRLFGVRPFRLFRCCSAAVPLLFHRFGPPPPLASGIDPRCGGQESVRCGRRPSPTGGQVAHARERLLVDAVRRSVPAEVMRGGIRRPRQGQHRGDVWPCGVREGVETHADSDVAPAAVTPPGPWSTSRHRARCHHRESRTAGDSRRCSGESMGTSARTQGR